MRLLALDTATESCSAALFVEGVVTFRYEEIGRAHGGRILPMVDELLKESTIPLRELNAIAFGRGPGGFTGVRLATSLAQGLALSVAIPVVGVSDLSAVAQLALDEVPTASSVVVCNDARMGEVYWASFVRSDEGLAALVGDERVSRPEAVHVPSTWARCDVLAGRGAAVYPQIARALPHDTLLNRLLPHAAVIAKLAVAEVETGHGVHPRDAAPVYVRDDVARPS